MGNLSSYVQKRSQFFNSLSTNQLTKSRINGFLIKPYVSDVIKFFLLPKTEAYPTQ